MKRFAKLLATLLLCSTTAAVCNYGTAQNPRHQLLPRSAGPTYSYDGQDGPLVWHSLSAANSVCATGKHQSPVNIVRGAYSTVDGSSLTFRPGSYPGGAEFENLGHTVQVYLDGSVTLNQDVYRIVQFHLHTPSEHHVESEHYSMELHFVAQSQNQSLAVMAFIVELASDRDKTSDVLAAALGRVQEIPQAGDRTLTDGLNFTTLQNHLSGSKVFQYSGSLTTPPCSEDVAFNVVSTPLYIGVDLYRALKSVVKFNARFTQAAPGQLNVLQCAHDSFVRDDGPDS
ncbi:hypothetical protein CDD83_3343 [Cordyceps sp. RAO-2017]|nr:hypothetical protein CDD83_3343 [Cordyceps sp. RAO-2017]